MSNLPEKRCENCRWFESFETVSQDGYCRHRSPISVEPDDSGDARWPIVFRIDWCGDWAKRSEPHEETTRRIARVEE